MGLVTKAADPLGNAKTGFYDPAAGSGSSNMLTKSNSGISGDAGTLHFGISGTGYGIPPSALTDAP